MPDEIFMRCALELARAAHAHEEVPVGAVRVRVDRVVFGMGDPMASACGSAFQLFGLPGLNHRCEITSAVLAAESLAFSGIFFARSAPWHRPISAINPSNL